MSNLEIGLPYILAAAGVLLTAAAVGVILLQRYLRRQG